MSSNKKRKAVFQHVLLKGNAYKLGQSQAGILKRIPGFKRFLSSGKGSFSSAEFEKLCSVMEKYNPGINEEIKGFAEGMNIRQEDLVYYLHTYLLKGHCSHFAVLPSKTENNEVFIGRNYEFSDKLDDKRLCTMAVDGKYAFIGFSTMLFGFNEGMNEHGLTCNYFFRWTAYRGCRRAAAADTGRSSILVCCACCFGAV